MKCPKVETSTGWTTPEPHNQRLTRETPIIALGPPPLRPIGSKRRFPSSICELKPVQACSEPGFRLNANPFSRRAS